MKLLAVLIAMGAALWAHPHVFVDVYPSVGEKRVEVRWVFDEMTSNMLIMDYDFNHDGALGADEVEALRVEIFDTLAEYDYYTYFFALDRPFEGLPASKFGASVEANRLVFSFELPRPQTATEIRFYDPENWTGYRLTDAFVAEANPGASFVLHEREFEYFYGYVLELK